MKKPFTTILALVLCVIFALSGCTKSSTPEDTTPKDTSGRYNLTDSGEAIINDVTFTSDYTTDDNNRVFYEIFVGSFSDSDGDGIGDIRGIINRLDYLNDGDPDSGESLGVEGIWLSPIFKSPSYHKYDVSDYYTVSPTFGTNNDLWELIELCHERNIKVILDLPINHTSTANSMFVQFTEARKNNDTENKYYDFYSAYREGESVTGSSTYTKLAGTDTYYECNFSTDMPELNFDNPDVREEVLNIAKFWLDLGVDGFRFDGARYIYYGENTKTAEFWGTYLEELREIKSDIYTVAEVWDSDGVVKMYYPYVDCFDFTGSSTSGIIYKTAKGANASSYTRYVQNYVDEITGLRSSAMYMPFIANHDMDRAAGYLTPSTGEAQVAANLYILTPGSPFIYYGEEIGMKGNRGGASTDANRRLAMLWGDDDKVKDPTGATYDSSKQTNGTVASQIGDGDSLYNYYKKLIMIRKANPEIARGTYTSLTIDSKLGGFISTWNGSSVCVIHNTTTEELSVDLATVLDAGVTFETLNAVIGMSTASLSGTTLTVGPQTSVVLR